MARTSKRTNASEAAGDRRRRDLLAAAYELIALKGLEGLRTRDIAARAGVNISTLHYYFGSKSDLVQAVVTFAAEKFTGGDDLTKQLPDSTLRDHFERTRKTFERHPELAIVLQELALRAQRDPPTRDALRSIFKFWNLQVQSVVTAEMKAGRIRPQEDPHELALVVTSFILGSVTQHAVTPREIAFEALGRRLLRLVVGPPAR